MSIAINGQPVVSQMDVAATAGGPQRAVDLVFNDIQPRNGVIDIRFTGGDADMSLPGEAFVQAIEVGQGRSDEGAVPVTVLGRNLLRNGGFERWITDPKREPDPSRPNDWQFEADSELGVDSWLAHPVDDSANPAAASRKDLRRPRLGIGPQSPVAGGRRVS